MKISVIIVAVYAIALARSTLGNQDEDLTLQRASSPLRKRSIGDLILPLLGGFGDAGYNNGGGGSNLMGLLGSLITSRVGGSSSPSFGFNVNDREEDNYGSSSVSYDTQPGIGLNLNFGKIGDNFANGVRLGKAAAVAGGTFLRRLLQGVNDYHQLSNPRPNVGASYRSAPPPYRSQGPMHSKDGYRRPPPYQAGGHRESLPHHAGGYKESPPQHHSGGYKESPPQHHSGGYRESQPPPYEQERPEPPREYRSGREGSYQDTVYQQKYPENQHISQERVKLTQYQTVNDNSPHHQPEYSHNMPSPDQFKEDGQRYQYENVERRPNSNYLDEQSVPLQSYSEEKRRNRENKSEGKSQNLPEYSEIKKMTRPVYSEGENIESQVDYSNSERMSQYPLYQGERTTMEDIYPTGIRASREMYYSQDGQNIPEQYFPRENKGNTKKQQRKSNDHYQKNTPTSDGSDSEEKSSSSSSNSQESSKSDKTALDPSVIPVGILVSTSDSYAPPRKTNREKYHETRSNQNFAYQYVPGGYATGESQVSETDANLATGEGSGYGGKTAGYVIESGYESNPSVYNGNGATLSAYEQVELV